MSRLCQRDFLDFSGAAPGFSRGADPAAFHPQHRSEVCLQSSWHGRGFLLPFPPFLLISCSFLPPLAPTEKLIDLCEPWLTHEPCEILSAPAAPRWFGNPAACSNGWLRPNEFAAFWELLCLSCWASLTLGECVFCG